MVQRTKGKEVISNSRLHGIGVRSKPTTPVTVALSISVVRAPILLLRSREGDNVVVKNHF